MRWFFFYVIESTVKNSTTHIRKTARSHLQPQGQYLDASPAGKQQIGKQKTSRNQKDSYTSSSYDIHKKHSHSKPKQCISPDSFHFSHQKKHILFIIYASFVKIPYYSIIFLHCLRHQPHLQCHQKSGPHRLFPK